MNTSKYRFNFAVAGTLGALTFALFVQQVTAYTYKKSAPPKPAPPLPLGLLLQFSATGTGTRVIDPFPNATQAPFTRIGVVAGDTVTFTALFNPAKTLPASKYVWTGAKAGTGSTISITFPTAGSYTETLRVGGTVRKARITVVNVTGPSLDTWSHTMGNIQIAIRCNNLSNEALAWATATPLLLGLHNGQADAGRHKYWNTMMAIEYGAAIANTIGTGHEVDGLAAGDPHNEAAMDMENNAKGVALAPTLTIPAGSDTLIAANAATIQAAVVAEVKAGGDTIIEDQPNTGNAGLLIPSNK